MVACKRDEQAVGRAFGLQTSAAVTCIRQSPMTIGIMEKEMETTNCIVIEYILGLFKDNGKCGIIGCILGLYC